MLDGIGALRALFRFSFQCARGPTMTLCFAVDHSPPPLLLLPMAENILYLGARPHWWSSSVCEPVSRPALSDDKRFL